MCQDNTGLWSEWGRAPRSFTTLCPGGGHYPDQPVLKAPLSDATQVSLTPTLEIVSYSDPDGDSQNQTRWWIATDNGFSNLVWEKYDSTGNMLSEQVDAGVLQSNTTYYWRGIPGQYGPLGRVVCHKGCTTGWAPRPPNVPQLKLPANGSGGVGVTPALELMSFSDPDSDSQQNTQWQISTDSAFLHVVKDSLDSDADKLREVLPGLLEWRTTYHWRAKVQDSTGLWSDWSAAWSFSTGNESGHFPVQPALKSPTDGLTSVSLTPTLEIVSYSDPDSNPHKQTRWWIATDSGFSNLVWEKHDNSGDMLSQQVDAGVLQPSTTYYWRAVFQDGTDLWGEWSDTWNFTTLARIPGDINGDGGVDVVDLLYFVDAFGSVAGMRTTTQLRLQQRRRRGRGRSADPGGELRNVARHWQNGGYNLRPDQMTDSGYRVWAFGRGGLPSITGFFVNQGQDVNERV